MKAIEIKSVEFGQIRSRKDGSVSCSFITPELRPSESAALFPLHGKVVRVLIEPHDVTVDDTVVVDTELEKKTPGQRLRGIIFCHWDNLGREGTFDAFYHSQMDKICQGYKTKNLPPE